MEKSASRRLQTGFLLPNIEGKIQGLKANQLKRLEKLGHRKVSNREVASVELLRALCDVANDTGRMVGLLLDRKGNVAHVVLGEPTRIYLPDVGRHRAGPTRLRGLRFCVAKPATREAEGEKKRSLDLDIDSDLITDLERLRLDLVLQVEALRTGLPGRASMASVLPSAVLDEHGDFQRHQVDAFQNVQEISVDASAFITALEEELSRHAGKGLEREKIKGERDVAVIVGAYTSPKHVFSASLEELNELARTAGVGVVDTIVQRRKQLDPRTVVGKGKLEEICLNALHRGADLLIFDLDLSPSQLNAITDLTDLRILDRSMLILDIFARRATSREGRMQVELAQLKYSLPRLAKKQTGLSRLTGGIGGQGPGETKLEVDRRRAKNKIARLDRDLKKVAKNRQLRRQRRKNRSVPTIAIVGYTNAGKSTLLNALTGAEVFADNLLFATLDPTSRRLRFPTEREVVLIDTVGFIRDLPETLLNAFRATLEELHDADLLLQVVDIGDPNRERQISAVVKVLEDIGVEDKPRLLVLNKCDSVDEQTAAVSAENLEAAAVSALKRIGFGPLLNRAAEILWQEDALHAPQTWVREPPSSLAEEDPENAETDETTEIDECETDECETDDLRSASSSSKEPANELENSGRNDPEEPNDDDFSCVEDEVLLNEQKSPLAVQ
ncbi:MAG: GTPase HflX [Deltaproteobacteria bacterium]|nr:GTPase HflX [Deltaproteobacteria bacterium]